MEYAGNAANERGNNIKRFWLKYRKVCEKPEISPHNQDKIPEDVPQKIIFYPDKLKIPVFKLPLKKRNALPQKNKIAFPLA